MDQTIHQLRVHPEFAIFLALFVGFWIGKIKIGKFSLSVITNVLLVGVLVGQLNITVDGPIEFVFSLLFLLVIGYKVDPQFFQGLKKDGPPQMGFAIIMCVFCLTILWILAKIMGYDVGEAAGLLTGSQMISAVISVVGDTINELNVSPETKEAYNNIIPVSYAVTYIFGTVGSVWVLDSLGPKLLGGLDKVKAVCRESEAKMENSEADQPGFMPAVRPVTFRVYKVDNEWFGDGKRVPDPESYFQENDKHLFVECVRQAGIIVKEITLTLILRKGDEVVLSGRREYVIGEEDWIGPEVLDLQLLDFPAEALSVMVTRKIFAGEKIGLIRSQKFMHGVSIRRIKRVGIDISVLSQTIVDAGDIVELVGIKHEVDEAVKKAGYADRPTNQIDMIFAGLGILIGGLIGVLSIHMGGVPISLSTSRSALVGGLFFGWLRSRHPIFRCIPGPALWILGNVGLNMFIAVVDIAAGPSFVQGFKEVGLSLFIVGALATSIPLIVGTLMGRYLFKFRPALILGHTVGARTTTAVLGTIQEAAESKTPALGYTVTYAVGDTLPIIWGVVTVSFMQNRF